MKIGLFSYSYHLAFGAHDVFTPTTPMNLFEFIDRASAMGFAGVQIDPMHYASLENDYLETVAGQIKNTSMFVEHGTWGVTVDILKRGIDVCQILGGSLFRTALGFTRYDAGINVRQRLAEAIDALNTVKSIAEDRGIKIAIENHCDATTDELIDMMKTVDSPNIGVCVDPGNFMIYLENPVESIARLAPYIFTTHLKDYAVSMENYGFKYFGVPLGEGVIDLHSIVRILRDDVGLDYVILEVPVERDADEQLTLQKEDEFVRRSLQYAHTNLGLG